MHFPDPLRRSLQAGIYRAFGLSLIFGATLPGTIGILRATFAALHSISATGFGGRLDGLIAVIVFDIFWFGTLWAIMQTGERLFLRGRQMASPSADLVLEEDRRPPVLYLRSFRDDLAGEATHALPLSAIPVPTLITEEEQLCSVFRDRGPVVAIGCPGEELPRLGAARLNVSEAEWKDRVADLLAAASFVLIRIGGTDGLLWELRKAINLNRPGRLILSIPRDDAAYRAFHSSAAAYFPKGLPPPDGVRDGMPMRKGSGIAAMLRFGSGWEPAVTFLPQRTWAIAPLKRALSAAVQNDSDSFERSQAATRRSLLGWLSGCAVFAVAMCLGYGIYTAVAPSLETATTGTAKARIFGTTAIEQFVNGAPPELQACLKQEIALSWRATEWFEQPRPEAWKRLGREIGDGLGYLSDENRLRALRGFDLLLRSQSPGDRLNTLISTGAQYTGSQAFVEFIVPDWEG